MEYIPLVASAVFSLVFGFIYYHPKVAGSIWAKESGVQMGGNKKSGMAKGIVSHLVAALITAYVLSMLIGYAGAAAAVDAAVVGVWAWLGFVATLLVGSVVWEGKSVKLFVVNNVYHLINLAVMSAILVSV